MSRTASVPRLLRDRGEQRPLAPLHGGSPAWPLAIAVLVALIVTGFAGIWLGLVRQPPPAFQPGEWSVQRTAGASAVAETSGARWTPDPGVQGGHLEYRATDVQGTASPELYRNVRVGLTSWAVDVPSPGRYAVDLLVAEPPSWSFPSRPGERAFDVFVADGHDGQPTLLGQVGEPAHQPGHAGHVTGTVPVSSGHLVLRFAARSQEPAVTGLAVTSAGPLTPSKTLFRDTFDGPAGSAPSSSWRPDIGAGPWGEGELQAYTADPSNSGLDGQGHLVITARRQPFRDATGTREYTAARLTTKGRFSFTYGSVEARLKVPAGQGLWPAFWALGDNIDTVDWPRSGELDVMEVLGGRPDVLAVSIHGRGDDRDPRGWRNQPVSTVGKEVQAGRSLAEGFHTYSADVQPGAVTFRLDGEVRFVAAREDLRPGQQWPFDHAFYLLVNVAVGGTWGGPPDATTSFPASLVVDQVTVTG